MTTSFYSELKDLTLEIGNLEVGIREKQVSEDFTRKTSIIKLEGDGEIGIGEDVIYEPEKHVHPDLSLKGEYTFEEFSEKLMK